MNESPITPVSEPAGTNSYRLRFIGMSITWGLLAFAIMFALTAWVTTLDSPEYAFFGGLIYSIMALPVIGFIGIITLMIHLRGERLAKVDVVYASAAKDSFRKTWWVVPVSFAIVLSPIVLDLIFSW